MPSEMPRLFLARHGDTAWTDSRQRTGRTDIPLNAVGRERARQLGDALRRFTFARVYTSPLQRAAVTCELAGFGAIAEVDPDLVEWDYGSYEGLVLGDIHRDRPGWELFRDGCPGGESPDEVAVRTDRFLARVRDFPGDVLAFSSGHLIRMVAARWLGLPAGTGRCFYCRPASVGVLGYEHESRNEPILALWNHIAPPPDGSVTAAARTTPSPYPSRIRNEPAMTIAMKQEARAVPTRRPSERVGRSGPLGATLVAGGANFSLFSRVATGVEILLFDGEDDAYAIPLNLHRSREP